MARKRRKRVVCPNCDNKLREDMNFCFKCGQENHIKRVSMKMLLSDFSSTYFSFDSKLFSSLKLLLFRPSFLSSEYLNGKIEQYLRPIRMYIFISFIFFLLNSLLATDNMLKGIDFTKDGEPVDIEVVQEDLKSGEIKGDEEVSFQELDKRWFDGKLTKVFSDDKEIQLFVVFLKSKLPLLFFLLIPILGMLLFIVFYKKKYYYVDHLVFALHLQSFFFVLLIVDLLINQIFKVDVMAITLLIFLIYGFIAARRFYSLGKFNTFIRLSFIGFTHSVISLVIFGFFFIMLLKYYKV